MHGPNCDKALVFLTFTKFNLYQRLGKQNESSKLRVKYRLNGQLYKKGKVFPHPQHENI
jgi:hypothetical protein